MIDKRIGLVLSGGGVKGLAHAGTLKAFEESGISFDLLSGSSAGAIVASFYAAGHSPDVILEFFKNNSHIFQWRHYSIRKAGFLDTMKFRPWFTPFLPERFEDLKKELYISVTNMTLGRVEYLSTGDLSHGVLASAAVPGVFAPIEMNGHLYADGGVMNNFPIEPILKKVEIRIGINVTPPKSLQPTEINNTIRVIRRANDLMVCSSALARYHLFDYIFEPKKLSKVGIFETKKVEMAFDIGYEHAMKNMDKLKEAIQVYSY